MRGITTVIVAAGLLTAACASGGSNGTTSTASATGSPPAASPSATGAPTGSPSPTEINPAEFSPDITNEWFPLTPGTVLVYAGTKDGEKVTEYFAPSKETVKINGVTCRVVQDRVYVGKALEETTRDYYAQNSNGDVWYFGEDTAEIDEHGNMVSTDGTWHYGEAGAQPGLFMPANPQVGLSARQEYYPGHAEDFFEVVNLSTAVAVPYRKFSDTVLTKEWTPLEPDVLDNKYYACGIGTVKEVTVKGGQEEFVLVEVRHTGA